MDGGDVVKDKDMMFPRFVLYVQRTVSNGLICAICSNEIIRVVN